MFDRIECVLRLDQNVIDRFSISDLKSTLEREPSGGGVSKAAVALSDEQEPALPILLYVPPTAPAMAALLPYVEAGFEYQLEGVDDQPSAMQERLQQLTALPLEKAVMALLAEGLAQSSDALRRAIRRLFLRPEDFPSVTELHQAACTSRRSLCVAE